MSARWRYVGTVEAAPWDDKRVCANCGHHRVHHYGATDGRTPPQPIAGCMVWIGHPKDKGVSRKGSCGCRSWEGRST